MDDTSGFFYYTSSDGESQWDRPSSDGAEAGAAGQMAVFSMKILNKNQHGHDHHLPVNQSATPSHGSTSTKKTPDVSPEATNDGWKKITDKSGGGLYQ